jgi:glycosyltransferase involved in cell wall biosynthesis
MGAPRVLLLHNRYRIEGGEERSVALQRAALARAGVPVRVLERRSAEAGRGEAALALLRGGADAGEVARAVSEHGATVLHAHNMQPLFGPRGLAAGREAGAKLVLHLHNVRLFCAIAVASRDGGPCFRCRGRFTLPGLALNCRGSLPEAATYAVALSRQLPQVLETVDRFVAPSRYAVGQLALLGVPSDRIEPLEHYLPAEAFAERSAAAAGAYALVASRLSEEKGIDTAIGAAAESGVPLRIAGEGPAQDDLAALAESSGARVDFLGRVGRQELAALLRGAAMLLMPSRYHEFSPYSALEAMAAGVPVLASRLGGLPELIGADRCLAPNDVTALASRMAELWQRPDLREHEGEALLRRARERHAEAPYLERLLDLYERVGAPPAGP